MKRLAHGGTQNSNTCLSSKIWNRCPKTSFIGANRVLGGVTGAVSIFNEGAFEVLSVMNRLKQDVAQTTPDIPAQRDDERGEKAAAAVCAGPSSKEKTTPFKEGD